MQDTPGAGPERWEPGKFDDRHLTRVAGEADQTGPLTKTNSLDPGLQAGVPVVHVEYPQTEHAFDVVILSRYSPANQAALYELERFLALA